MAGSRKPAEIDFDSLGDAALVELARRGRREAFLQVIRRCNQRLFRIARGVVHDEAEAEDVVQAAYVDAFEHLDGFRGDASVLTWLTRIVLNEARGRLRARKPTVDVDQIEVAQGEAGRVAGHAGKALRRGGVRGLRRQQGEQGGSETRGHWASGHWRTP